MTQEEIGLQHYLSVLWRRKWVIFSVFMIVFMLSAIWISMTKTSYKAKSLVGLKSQLMFRAPLLPFAPGTDRPDLALHGESYVQVINGLPFAEKVANALAAKTIPVEPAEVHGSVKAEFQDPDLIFIYASSVDPQRAISIANTAAEAFVEENRASIRAEIVSYAQYAQGQMEQHLAELRKSESAITRFKESLGFVNVNDEIMNLKNTIVAFDKERAIVKTQMDVAEVHRDGIVRIAKISGEGDHAVLMDDPQVENLHKLQDLLSDARLRYTDKHPLVQNLEAQVQSVEARLRGNFSAGGSSLTPERFFALREDLTKTDTMIADLRTALASWEKQIELVHAKLSDFPEKQYRLEVLEASAAEAKQRYTSWRDRVDEANSKASTVQGNASVADLALDATPVTRKSTSIALAFIVSAMMSLGFGFVSEFADSTLRNPEEITRSGMGYLGSIAKIKDPKQLVFAEGKGLHQIAESYTKIYSNIKFAAVEGPLHSILVTSGRKGEGKSTTLVNLACAIAAAGKRVIIVDTDLRNPTIQRILGTRHQMGVTNILAGECALDDVLQETVHPGLYLLPSGPIPPNPAELLQSGAMKELIADLETRADIVTFDSPPALLVADAMLLSSELDAAIVVAEAGGITRHEVQQVRDTLQVAKARILGVILNKIVETPGDYYYNYYSYYKYYQDPQEKSEEPVGAMGWLRDSMKSLSGRMGGRT